MSVKRLLTNDEIEDILSIIKINIDIPVETAVSVSNANKELLRKQLKSVLIYPEMIPKLRQSIESQYFSSLIQPGESVGVTGAQSIGEKQTQTTLNSVDYTERVLYIRDNKAIVEPIGKMIDEILHINKKHITIIPDNQTEYLDLVKHNFYIPSGDEKGVIEWLKIEAITRHLPSGKLVKVVTESGRTVMASQSKSFLVWGGDKFVDILGSDIKVGDILPTTKYLPRFRYNMERIDILGYFTNPALHSIIDLTTTHITLDKNFGSLVGLYLSNNRKMLFHINSRTVCIIENVIEFCNQYNINYILTTSRLEIKSRLLSHIFKIACNHSVPFFAYTAPLDFIRSLINAYFSVNSIITEDGYILFSSPSEKLIHGLAILMSYFHIFGVFNSFNTIHLLIIKGSFVGIFITEIRPDNIDLLCSIIDNSKESHPIDIEPENNMDRHVWFDKVKFVEYVNATNGFVYDFTVEKTRNFNLFNGLVVRDTFHKAGSGEKTVTTGVPRVEELLNATKDPKAINCTVFMKNKHETIEQMRKTIGHSIVELTFAKISKSYTIIENKQKEPWYESFKIMYGETFTKYKDCVSLKLNMEILFEYKLNMETIRNILMEEYSDMECVFSPDNIGQMDIFVNTENIDLPENRLVFIDSDNACKIYLEEVVQPLLYKIVICGIPNVSAIYFKEDVTSFETDGSNFQKIMGLPFVDSDKTISNNVWDIYNVLGIEAARQFLIEEFMSTMEGINKCHIQLLVEKMTHSGSISSISRYTMRTEESGPFSKASFEETMDNFLKAGIYGQSEETKGVSSSIICGKRSQIGSGFCELSMNIDALNKGENNQRTICEVEKTPAVETKKDSNTFSKVKKLLGNVKEKNSTQTQEIKTKGIEPSDFIPKKKKTLQQSIYLD